MKTSLEKTNDFAFAHFHANPKTTGQHERFLLLLSEIVAITCDYLKNI